MKKVLLLLLGVALTNLVGCGDATPPTTEVKGKVTVTGKGPLTGGAIVFTLVSNPQVTGGGQIAPDGTYTVPLAPVGECKVTIDNSHLRVGGKVMSSAGQKMNTAPAGLATPPGAMAPPKYVPIDLSYAKVDTTTLKATVAEGATVDLEVK